MDDGQNSAEISGATQSMEVVHQRFTASVGFDTFTANLERILGRFDPSVSALIQTDPKGAADRIRKMEGEQGLMTFLILDHGAVLGLAGKKQKAKQYLIGNPLTAIQMTSRNIGAALYAPLRVLVYENSAGDAVVEYDQITSFVQPFDDAEVSSVATTLDAKLPALLRLAVELSGG